MEEKSAKTFRLGLSGAVKEFVTMFIITAIAFAIFLKVIDVFIVDIAATVTFIDFSRFDIDLRGGAIIVACGAVAFSLAATVLWTFEIDLEKGVVVPPLFRGGEINVADITNVQVIHKGKAARYHGGAIEQALQMNIGATVCDIMKKAQLVVNLRDGRIKKITIPTNTLAERIFYYLTT